MGREVGVCNSPPTGLLAFLLLVSSPGSKMRPPVVPAPNLSNRAGGTRMLGS